MTKDKTRTRLIVAFVIVCLCLVALLFRAGWWQIVKGDELAAEAISQQTKDTVVEAARGSIYDRNGEELAASGYAYSIWVRPAGVTTSDKEDEKKAEIDERAELVAEALGMKKSKVKAAMNKETTLVKLAKGVDKDKADKIRKLLEDGKITGFEVSEDTKRYYPMGSFASHILGNVSDDNRGLSGIELYYNSELTGLAGRWSRNTDVSGEKLSYGQDKYYAPEDGNSIVLTIDDVIQTYVEKAIAKTQKSTKAKRVMAIVMDVENGDILSMAMTPDYDPNSPREVPSEDKEEYADMSESEQLEYLNSMWRNPMVSDVYEPGSTFKLITTSIALEEGVIDMNDRFYCSGSMQVEDYEIKCWSDDPHGSQTLKEAVANSCNPALMQIGAKIGLTKFYQYLDLFEITGTTGIDLPGEGNAILQKKEDAGPVGLATISFGQGVAVTPIQLITAVSAIGNDGIMMRPHVMKEIKDSDGNTIEEYEPQIVRKIISKKTSSQICDIMEYAVTDGGVSAAAVEGYRIGGKTGTAYKPENGGYSKDTWSSFIGLAPIDDPKIAVLVIVDSPQGEKYGSLTAAPCGQRIYKNVLPYLGIEGSEDTSDSDDKVKVPDITGKKYSDAVAKLEKKGLSYKVKSGNKKKDFKVKEQYPKAGTKVEKGSRIYIYGD